MDADLSYKIQKAKKAYKTESKESLLNANLILRQSCENLDRDFNKQLAETNNLKNQIEIIKQKGIGYEKLSMQYVKNEYKRKHFWLVVVSVAIEILLGGGSAWIINKLFSCPKIPIIILILIFGVLLFCSNKIVRIFEEKVVYKINPNDTRFLELVREKKIKELFEEKEEVTKNNKSQKSKNKKKKHK